MTGRRLLVLLSLGLSLAACRSAAKKAASSRCTPYTPEVCERACNDEGVLGKGGCMTAGEGFQGRAIAKSSGAKPDDLEHASRAFERACDGGLSGGCASLVDLLERPVTQPRGKGPIPTLSDRDMGRREKALARMCDADAKRWCPRLGRALLGIDERRAKEAFVKGCREAKGKECHDPARLVRSAAHWQKLCKENASYGCARLATLVQHYDPARATRAVTHECTMRKLRDRDACVKLRLDGAPDPRAAALQEAREMGLIGMVGAPKEEALPLLSSSTPRKIEKGGRMRFGVVSGLKKDAIDALQQAAAEPLLECYRRYLAINPRLEGRVTAGFQLDGRGYPYQMKNAGSDLPDSNVVSCVLYALEAIHVAGPRGSMVVLPVMFSPQ